MIYKQLGNTKEVISAIGQGTIGAGSRSTATADKIKQRIDVMRLGIEAGITFLDTGEDYEEGHAEEIAGRVIRGIREKVFISSKFKPANNSYNGVMNAAEGSLKRLGTDYIDLYQIQWPDPLVPVSETMEALSRLIDQGKIRFAGVSNFNVSQVEEANACFGGRIVSVQTEYNLFSRFIEDSLMPYCEEKGITLIAYSPLSQWNQKPRLEERGLLERLSVKYGVAVSGIMMNWVISHRTMTALTRTMNSEHVKANALAADFKMEKADIEEVDRVFARKPVYVPTGRIRVADYDADETHIIYTTLEEALENKRQVRPSPVDLAEEMRRGDMLRPVELMPTADKSGVYDYDLTHGRTRFWAWVIAFGNEIPIPAKILGEDQDL